MSAEEGERRDGVGGLEGKKDRRRRIRKKETQ